MISTSDLRKLSRARLKDAEILFNNGRYDSSYYLCGYAVELILKARIGVTLKWGGFPETAKDVDGVDMKSFHIHTLAPLLSLSGRSQIIKQRHLAHWSIVAAWNVEKRYLPVGTKTALDAEQMIIATKVLVQVI